VTLTTSVNAALDEILRFAVDRGVSDVHLKVGRPPVFRRGGVLVSKKDSPALTADVMVTFVRATVNKSQLGRFEAGEEIDTGFGLPGVGRFRINIFRQRGEVGMVFRVISPRVSTLRELGLPRVLEKLATEQRGLVLVTGPTGSGKSTTLAAMVEHINTSRSCHIITIEDPIEYLIDDKRSLVNQREVGIDTSTFLGALRASLREDPDVILIGEMRDLETIETTILASETGHLVMSTLHTVDATQTINRIIGVFPPHQQRQIRLRLGSVLKGVISQRLIPRADGTGMIAAVEVMVNTALVRDLIVDESRTHEIPGLIEKGKQSYGMQTFDQAIMDLYRAKQITYDEALRQASNPSDFALKVSGITSGSDSTDGH